MIIDVSVFDVVKGLSLKMTDNKTKTMGNLKVPLFIHVLLTANSILRKLIHPFFCTVATSPVKICVMTWTVLTQGRRKVWSWEGSRPRVGASRNKTCS